MSRTANSSTDLELCPLPNVINVNSASRCFDEEEGDDKLLEEDDVQQPDNAEVVLHEGATEEETDHHQSIQDRPLFERQGTIIKEPLDAAMAELAASIDGLDTAETPRGEGKTSGAEVAVAPVSMMMPTSDFEEEWRSESEDGDGSDQILQVNNLLLLFLLLSRLSSPSRVSSHK